MPTKSDTQQPHRLKYALVTETFQPEINGVAMTLGKIAEHLAKKQHLVQVFRPQQSRMDKPSHTKHLTEHLVAGMPIPFYQHLKFGFPAKSHLIKCWSANKPDVVHIATEGPLGWSALQAAKQLNIPVISSYHTNFHQYSQHYGASFLVDPIRNYLRHFHNQTLATLAPTAQVVHELESSGYNNVSIMARGVDTTQFHPAMRSNHLRKSWGASDEDLVIIHVGRLAKEKNIHLVLDAFTAIQKEKPSTKLVFVGDGPMRNSLAKACPHAIFSGNKQGRDLAEHYASADLFIFPSMTETFGNVVPEALASGLCVIAYDYAAAGSIIKHGVNGLLAPFNQSKTLIETALNATNNMNIVAQCREQSAASIANHQWDKVIDELERLLYATANGFKPTKSATSKPNKNKASTANPINLNV
ncbi:glycosyltransferase family 4 protein [Candidatus Methylopumilus turicensis]|nr:glycosyltransferase family 1 protein [Candidatus Methylopumilus turicensis]